MVSRFIFTKCIKHIQNMCEYEDELYRLASKYDSEVMPLPDRENCADLVVELIEAWCNDISDGAIGDMVGYFCWELDFGKKWKPGCITYQDNDIDISTIDKLYDYICEVIN